jgi:putative membrane protein
MHGFYYGWGFGHMLFAGFRVIFWVAIILFIIYLIRYFRIKGQLETPLDILRKRYARGEITKAEFDKMREDLRQ